MDTLGPGVGNKHSGLNSHSQSRSNADEVEDEHLRSLNGHNRGWEASD